jgi:hypothetical protein
MYCQFDEAWRGQCRIDSDQEYCAEHRKEKCCVCGEQATHSCAMTSQLVCGFPLCNNCEHTPMGFGHRKKTPDPTA